MRLLLRILAGLASLILVALLTVVLIAPTSVAPVLANLAEVNIAVRIAAVVVFYVLLLGLLYLQIRRTPRGSDKSDMLTVGVGGAITAITIESVRERILKAVSQIPDVASVGAELHSVRCKAAVELEVTMKNDEVNIPTKQKEISRAIEQVVKKQLGLQMAGPARINIRLSPVTPPILPKPAQSATAPLTPAVPAPAPVSIPATPPPNIEQDEPLDEPEPRGGLLGALGFNRHADETPDEPQKPDESEPTIGDGVQTTENLPIAVFPSPAANSTDHSDNSNNSDDSDDDEPPKNPLNS